jgi:serine/threonine protein kinase
MQSVKMTGAGGLTSWEPPSIPEAARLFPQYEVLELIGRGGMGAVYRARQLALDRIVAIKLLPLEVSVDNDFAERFKREARTMARMNHPHIVSVFDFGTTSEGHLFFVMEYVEGTTLHHIIKTTGLKPPQALEIIVGVCEALAYAHVEGVVHRDIKPANVLVDVRGRVKVTDFGLARLNNSTPEQLGYTMTGTVLGTPDYMAPEQKRGMRVDHRADIYSLGVMLYEMLCGQVPQGIFDPPSIRAGVDERVDQVVIRAMQQEPDRRYQNTAEMRHEVQTIRMSHDPQARAPQPRVAGQSGGKSRSGVLISSIAAVLVAVGATAYFLRDKNPPPTNPGNNVPGSQVAVVTPDQATPATPPTPGKAEPASPTPSTPVAVTPGTPSNPPPEPGKTPAPTPSVALQPATPPSPPANPSTPSTSLTPPVSQPEVVSSKPPPVVERPVVNPDMANAVVQLSPNPPGQPGAVIPTVIAEPWKDFAQQGDSLVKQRDPDSAVVAYERAIEVAESATPPASPMDLARLHQKIGNIEAQRGSPAVARGSFENAKRELQRVKTKTADVTQMITEIDGTLRRLPRE